MRIFAYFHFLAFLVVCELLACVRFLPYQTLILDFDEATMFEGLNVNPDVHVDSLFVVFVLVQLSLRSCWTLSSARAGRG